MANNPLMLHQPLDLGDGLRMRRGTLQDADAVAEFNSIIHSDFGPENPIKGIEIWTKDLMSGRHPTTQASDFTIVEDSQGKIVSTLNLISQQWSLGGITFKVGRPELVGTLAEYRNRGLVRKQFEAVHAWSAARGEDLQVITGIPYYYRLYGYEMALNLGGGRTVYTTAIPQLKDKAEPFRLRPAGSEDLAFIQQLYDQTQKRYLWRADRSAAEWAWEICDQHPEAMNRRAFNIIERVEDGQVVGYVAYSPYLWSNVLPVTHAELIHGVPWLEAAPSVLRALDKIGPQATPMTADFQYKNIYLTLGEEHPLYRSYTLGVGEFRNAYTYYVRIPDLPAFLEKLRPVLEARLEASPAAGYTGKLRISFYRRGISLAFEKGKLTEIATYIPNVGEDGEAAFPGTTFNQLLTGWRSLDDLTQLFPDVWARSDAARLLLRVLFPKQVSNPWVLS